MSWKIGCVPVWPVRDAVPKGSAMTFTAPDRGLPSRPNVTVLMATYNGVRYLPEQVDSILNQAGVNVHLVVSDDQSGDGTWEWLVDKAAADTRVLLLPRIEPSGGFAANFYRLLCDAPLTELVAFSDQDDVWMPSKLTHHAAVLHTASCEGISSNVTAVTARGTRTLIRKSYPQRRLDYLFEAPGPGSTFVFTRRLADELRGLLTDHNGPGRAVQRHDWLTYAVCRRQSRPPPSASTIPTASQWGVPRRNPQDHQNR